jgi:hypothetical protein
MVDTPVVVSQSSTSTAGGIDLATYAKWAAGFALMASIFVVDYFKIAAPNYVPLAVGALSALGMHSAAKTLN